MAFSRCSSRGAFGVASRAAVAAALLIVSSPASAQNIVFPDTVSGAPGNTNNSIPFDHGSSVRFQQVYAASGFSSLSGPHYITQIAFRPDEVFGEAFSTTNPSVRIDLSATSATPDALSATFADNIGANNATVYNGALTLSSADTAGPNGTTNFDVVITLSTPFAYMPSDGNLLLDIFIFGVGFSTALDAQSALGDSVSRVFTRDTGVNSPIGVPDSIGLVTRFTVAEVSALVPEPATFFLLASGLATASGVAAGMVQEASRQSLTRQEHNEQRDRGFPGPFARCARCRGTRKAGRPISLGKCSHQSWTLRPEPGRRRASKTKNVPPGCCCLLESRQGRHNESWSCNFVRCASC